MTLTADGTLLRLLELHLFAFGIHSRVLGLLFLSTLNYCIRMKLIGVEASLAAALGGLTRFCPMLALTSHGSSRTAA